MSYWFMGDGQALNPQRAARRRIIIRNGGGEGGHAEVKPRTVRQDILWGIGALAVLAHVDQRQA